jgi:prepilin-type processing-associated H-X9-DG protein
MCVTTTRKSLGPVSNNIMDFGNYKIAFDLIYPYAPNLKLYFCPSVKSKLGLSYFGNYGVNSNVCRQYAYGATDPGGKENKVDSPSKTLLAFDSGAYTSSEYWLSCPDIYWYLPGTHFGQERPYANYSSPEEDDFTNGRHAKGLNLGWCDGHVTWSDGFSLYSHPEWFKREK